MIPAILKKPASAGLTRKILENSVALFTSQLLAKVFRVLANFLLARFLGPENFGSLALVLSFAELFRFLPDFGLDRTLVRRMARGQTAHGVAPNLSLRVALSSLAVVVMGMTLFFADYPRTVELLIYFYALSFFLQAGSATFAAYFQAQLKSLSLVWAYTVSGLLYLGLILGGIFSGQGLTFFVASLLFAEGSLLLLFALTFLKKGGKLAAFSLSELGAMVKEALPIALYLALGAAYFRLGTLIVYHYAGERGAGLYSACFRLNEAFLMLAASVAASLFPVFSRLKKEDKAELSALFERSFFGFMPFTLLLAILITGLSAPIIHFLYGEAYAPSAAGLSVIIWSLVFMIANTLSTNALLASDREQDISKITAVNLLVNLGLNFYLVPRFGFIGACWAALATEAVNFVLQAAVLQKILVPKLLSRILPYFIVPAFAVLWFLFYPTSFKTAGIWLFTFGYLAFILNRRGSTA
ncbi:MAG: flippase [candidate division Zixibacteria bacterium]|nr:flippase [candidate division Zixibacteria bacterium]MCI0596486.1 flippase [candidate division Zixibacteria bacterium]